MCFCRKKKCVLWRRCGLCDWLSLKEAWLRRCGLCSCTWVAKKQVCVSLIEENKSGMACQEVCVSMKRMWLLNNSQCRRWKRHGLCDWFSVKMKEVWFWWLILSENEMKEAWLYHWFSVKMKKVWLLWLIISEDEGGVAFSDWFSLKMKEVWLLWLILNEDEGDVASVILTEDEVGVASVTDSQWRWKRCGLCDWEWRCRGRGVSEGFLVSDYTMELTNTSQIFNRLRAGRWISGRTRDNRKKMNAGRRQYANETSFSSPYIFQSCYLFSVRRGNRVSEIKSARSECSGKCESFITAERDVIMTRRLFVCGRETERNILLLP